MVDNFYFHYGKAVDMPFKIFTIITDRSVPAATQACPAIQCNEWIAKFTNKSLGLPRLQLQTSEPVRPLIGKFLLSLPV